MHLWTVERRRLKRRKEVLCILLSACETREEHTRREHEQSKAIQEAKHAYGVHR